MTLSFHLTFALLWRAAVAQQWRFYCGETLNVLRRWSRVEQRRSGCSAANAQWRVFFHTHTMATAAKQTGSMGTELHLPSTPMPFLLLMDWEKLQAAKLCVGSCRAKGKKKARACSMFQPTDRQEAEPGRGKNLVVVVGGFRRQLHTSQFTEVLLHHTILNNTAAPFVAHWLLLGLAVLLWFSWRCG